MDASVVLWENWHEQVKQLFVGVHGHQKKTLAVCVLGIILSGSAVLQRIAENLHLEGISQAKMPSIERRLARFVANRRIQVLPIWRTFLEHVLPQWHGQAVRLVLDMTPCGDHARYRVSGPVGAFARVAPDVACDGAARRMGSRPVGPVG